MPSRITSVSIPSNPSWKITNDASKQALLDAALRISVSGTDTVRGSKKKDPKQFIVNLRTDEELKRGFPSLLAPTAVFGKLRVVDRDEIEGCRFIQQLLRDFKESQTAKPICIGVFGPPGSGKSFGVKQIADEVLENEKKGKSESLVFNLAQMSEPGQLTSAFFQIIKAGNDGSVPLAFFDEFDSSLGGVDLGWLRYFLAPMNDGEFIYENQTHKIGKAVLVFAGGTSSTLRNFAREEANTEKEEKVKFEQAKGPDFVSRLNASLNILGVNRREDSSDQAYLLRRAIIIRGALEDRKLIGRTRKSLVDRDFLKRLLTIGKYKHGARSIMAVMKMCIGKNGLMHLPPSDQLEMHIDKSDVDTLLSR